MQHALRAFTPKDQKAVKATAQTMRPQPGLDIEAAITELAVGEALVSFLDDKGRPCLTERAFVLPPAGHIGPITPAQRQALLANSLVAGVYEKLVDRESAYEKLQAQVNKQNPAGNGTNGANGTNGSASAEESGFMGEVKEMLFGSVGPRGGKKDGIVQAVAKDALRSVGKEIMRGVLGSLMGGGSRRR